MRATHFINTAQGSLITDFAARMSEQLVRQRANLEVRAARAAAEDAIKARSDFLGNMNHELRTPLNAIIGFATMLRDRELVELKPEQRDEYADYILQSADLLLGHINTILEVAALESGNVEFAFGDMDLNEILAGAVEKAAIRAKTADVQIIRRDDGEAVWAFGDPVRIAQAVDHILQTAIRGSEKGGRILVRAVCSEAEGPEIAVRDEGAGHSENALNAALDVFAEANRGLDRAFSGPGVGYAIAKTFIELQGGVFSIKSREGRGTLVRLVLPDIDESTLSEIDELLKLETEDAA